MILKKKDVKYYDRHTVLASQKILDFCLRKICGFVLREIIEQENIYLKKIFVVFNE